MDSVERPSRRTAKDQFCPTEHDVAERCGVHEIGKLIDGDESTTFSFSWLESHIALLLAALRPHAPARRPVGLLADRSAAQVAGRAWQTITTF